MLLRVGCPLAIALVVAGCSSTSSNTAAPSSSNAQTDTRTVQQICDAKPWPQPLPDVTGQDYELAIMRDGGLLCFDNVKGRAPDGHDPAGNAAENSRPYKITKEDPPAGTQVGEHDLVTLELEPDPNYVPPVKCEDVGGKFVAHYTDGRGDCMPMDPRRICHLKPADQGEGYIGEITMMPPFPGGNVDSPWRLKTATNADCWKIPADS